MDTNFSEQSLLESFILVCFVWGEKLIYHSQSPQIVLCLLMVSSTLAVQVLSRPPRLVRQRCRLAASACSTMAYGSSLMLFGFSTLGSSLSVKSFTGFGSIVSINDLARLRLVHSLTFKNKFPCGRGTCYYAHYTILI